jgi:hypothetical protein
LLYNGILQCWYMNVSRNMVSDHYWKDLAYGPNGPNRPPDCCMIDLDNANCQDIAKLISGSGCTIDQIWFHTKSKDPNSICDRLKECYQSYDKFTSKCASKAWIWHTVCWSSDYDGIRGCREAGIATGNNYAYLIKALGESNKCNMI